MYLTQKQAENKELVKELASQITGEPVVDIQELRGCISFNYLINGKKIFKLPSHRTETIFWERQSHNLPRLQEQLGYQIPIPKVAYLNLFGNKIMGFCYPKIAGKVLTRSFFRQLPLSKKMPFFENLSGAVEQLHNVNPSLLPEPLPTYTDLLNLLLSDCQAVDGRVYLENIENAFQQKGIRLKKNSLCHLDLHPENIVLDDKNKIVGIVDWDNLCLGETFMEFYSNLYKPSDLRILRSIYQEKTVKKINPDKFNILDNLHKQISGLFTLGVLTHRLSKSETKTKSYPIHHWVRTLGKDTNRWIDFGQN